MLLEEKKKKKSTKTFLLAKNKMRKQIKKDKSNYQKFFQRLSDHYPS